MWMYPYFITAMEVGSAGKIWLTNGYKTYHYNYDLVDTRKHFRLDYTFILYIYMKCLSTFQCSGWLYGCILTPSTPWRWTELAESGSQLGTNILLKL